MAEKMDASKNTIHDIETGKKFVRAENLARFAAVFNVDVYKLFLSEDVDDYDTTRVVAQFVNDAKVALDDKLDEYINTKL